MMLSDMIIPGDKIDMKFLHQQYAEENGGETAPTYHSSVCDHLSDMEIEITMPMREGRMVLFQEGAECSLVFYTKRGMYQARGVVKERYRKDNLYLLAVRIKSVPVKFQRREFFRVDYLANVKYYEISREVAALRTTEELFAEIQNFDYIQAARIGTMQDISGGGVRFNSQEQHEKGSFILLMVRLTSEKMDETFYLVCQMIESVPHPSLENTYSNRAKFIFKDLKDREKIVRFVFEEERRIRRRELGE